MTEKKILAAAIFFVSALGPLPSAVALPGGSLSAYVTVSLAFLTLFLAVFFGSKRSFTSVPVVFFFCLALFSFLDQILIRHDPIVGLGNWSFVWVGIVGIYCLFSQRNRFGLKGVNNLIVLSGYCYILICLYFFWLYGKLSPAHALAGIVFFSYFISLAMFKSRLYMLPAMLILIFSLISSTRIVYLAEILIFAYAVMSFTHFKGFGTVKKMLVFLIFILAFIALLFLLNNFFGLSEKFVGDKAIVFASLEINTSGRISMWKVVIDSFWESPFVGTGLPGPVEMLIIPGWTHPHNDYLRIIHQFGILGFSIFFLFFLFVYKNLQAAYEEGKNAELNVRVCTYSGKLIFFGLLVTMFTDNVIVYSYVVYPAFVIFGISVSTKRGAIFASSSSAQLLSVKVPVGRECSRRV